MLHSPPAGSLEAQSHLARIDELLQRSFEPIGPKPPDSVPQARKKAYSETLSRVIALAFAEELRRRGMKDTRPSSSGLGDPSGAERRLAGGIGAKRVDVTWATPESGLLVAMSIKTMNFRDRTTNNYQKNLTNRRGDMLFEAVTLHRRFPYAVLAGFMFLDWEAAEDSTATRESTFANAHSRLRLFTGRSDPGGREEQYERLYLALLDANPSSPRWKLTLVGEPDNELEFAQAFDDIVQLVAERNFDFYQGIEGHIRAIR
jgi:hypothetical protein